MAEVLLSVVIPAYQAEATIERAVKSVLAIPAQEIEVIVVDDGSTDETASILEDLARRDSRIKVIPQQNSGRSIARNLGVEHAVGKWLMFADSDDYLLDESFPELVKYCQCSSAPLVVFGHRQSDKPELNERVSNSNISCLTAKRYVDALLWEPVPSCIENEWKYNHGAVWSRLYNRECVMRLIKATDEFLGPFPEKIRFSEDRLFNIAYLKMLGNVQVEIVPVDLYFRDVGMSQTCQVFHDDDAESLQRFINFVSRMEACGILNPREAKAVIARESLWQFKRLVRHLSGLNYLLVRSYLDILESSTISSAMKGTPYKALYGGKLWYMAWKLIGCSAPGVAFRLYVIAYRLKNVIKK